MRAMVYEQYGSPDVLKLRDVPDPKLTPDGVLIRIRAASLNRSDWEALTARPAYIRLSGTGFRKPKVAILGSDIAGTVEAVGADVTRFEPGHEVFGDIIWAGAQAFAEYVVVKETAPLAIKPDGVGFEQAAAIPQGAGLAYQGLHHKRETEPGDRVVIVGAGGGAGSFAVQLAKSAGAHVTGVDNGGKLDFMRSVGADRVIDFRMEDYTKGGPFDRILDFAGGRSIFANRRALADGGVYAIVGGSVQRILGAVTMGWLISKIGDHNMGLLMAKPKADELAHLAGLVAAGELTPMIDRTYQLAELADAFRYLGSDQAKGKLVVRI